MVTRKFGEKEQRLTSQRRSIRLPGSQQGPALTETRSGEPSPPASPTLSRDPSPVKPLARLEPTELSRDSRASPRVLSMAGQWWRLGASPEQKPKAPRRPGPEKGPFCSLCRRQWQCLQRVRSQGAVPYAFSLTPATATAVSPGAPACHSPFSLPADGIFEER